MQNTEEKSNRFSRSVIMSLNKKLSNLFYLTLIPGLLLGMAVSGILIWLYGNVVALPKFFEIYTVIGLVLLGTFIYYRYEASKEQTITQKAIKICVFISSFSFASNLMLVEFENFQTPLPITYLAIPLLVLVGASLVNLSKSENVVKDQAVEKQVIVERKKIVKKSNSKNFKK